MSEAVCDTIDLTNDETNYKYDYKIEDDAPYSSLIPEDFYDSDGKVAQKYLDEPAVASKRARDDSESEDDADEPPTKGKRARFQYLEDDDDATAMPQWKSEDELKNGLDLMTNRSDLLSLVRNLQRKYHHRKEYSINDDDAPDRDKQYKTERKMLKRYIKIVTEQLYGNPNVWEQFDEGKRKYYQQKFGSDWRGYQNAENHDRALRILAWSNSNGIKQKGVREALAMNI